MVPRWTGPENAKAWSVRPDLWPPGSRAVASPYGNWLRLASAYIGSTWNTLAPLEPYVVQGVAEALILAGQVGVDSSGLRDQGHSLDWWTPCP